MERQLSAEAGREVRALKTNHVTNTFVLSLLTDLDFICYSSFRNRSRGSPFFALARPPCYSNI